jgi:hypothetical protein
LRINYYNGDDADRATSDDARAAEQIWSIRQSSIKEPESTTDYYVCDDSDYGNVVASALDVPVDRDSDGNDWPVAAIVGAVALLRSADALADAAQSARIDAALAILTAD